MGVIGAHALLYSSEPEALRAVLRDVFGWKHVDAGGGWLISSCRRRKSACTRPKDRPTRQVSGTSSR